MPGTTNVVADALSRPAAAAVAAGAEWVCAAVADKAPLDLKDMALRQILCPQVQALRSSPGLRIIIGCVVYASATVSNFFENLRRYSQVKVLQRYQRHRWQICFWFFS